MKKVDVIIERGKDGSYSAYMDEHNLNYDLLGDGETVDMAISDFMNSYDEMKQYYKESGKEFKEVDFDFKYDLSSFLQHYSDVLTLAGLSRLTGVNRGQFSHYVTGHRRPSPKTVDKIDKKLHDFAHELSNLRFI